MKTRRSLALFLALLGATLLLAACGSDGTWQDRGILRDIQESPSEGKEEETGPPAPPSAEIGVALPLTGRLAPFGLAVRQGVNLALEERGEDGVRVVVLDTQGTEAGTRRAFQTLGARRTVLAALGPCTSGNARTAAKIAASSGLPLLLPTATAFDLTREKAEVFRICFTDPLQAAAMAIFARRTLGLLSVGIVAVRDDPYSLSLAEAFQRAFSGLGGDIRFLQWFGEDLDGTVAANALAVMRPPPDAVFVPAYFEESARFIRKARKQGYAGTFLGGDGWHDGAFLRLGGVAVAGSYFTTHFIADDPSRESSAFSESFRERYGEAPGPFAALGYDAGRLLGQIVTDRSVRRREDVRKALSAVEAFPGATGSITLDENGNTMKDAMVAKATEEGLRFEERIRFGPRVR